MGRRNETGHTNFENLKIEVQFDNNSGGSSVPSNQYENRNDKAGFGNHKRDNLQSSKPYNPRPNDKVTSKSMTSIIINELLRIFACWSFYLFTSG